MGDDVKTAAPIVGHGAPRLPSVEVASYNAEIKDDDGFVGDRANKGAFTDILDDWRKRVSAVGEDPLGETETSELGSKELEKHLQGDDIEAAGLVQGAIEEFAQDLTSVARRFLKLKAWSDIERLVIGGGFSRNRMGRLAIGRTSILLKAAEIPVNVMPIRNHPDEAGLIGALHLAPSWIFKAHEAILAVDIGGTNIRAGVVQLNLKRAKDLSKAAAVNSEVWRHGDEKVSRDEAVERLVDMIESLIDWSKKEKLKMAPFIGLACPGIIEADGSIDRGAQNLPGNWESSKFHLPTSLREAIPNIGGEETHIVMHNDAVVQGLSEVPFMQDVKKWGVFTIGTGLGNACFVNRGS